MHEMCAFKKKRKQISFLPFISKLFSEPRYWLHLLHFSGPSVWNNLDEELKSLSLHSFKQTMNKRYLSTYG